MKKMKMITATIALGTALLVLGGCASSQAAAAPVAKEVKIYQGLGQTSVYRTRVDAETKKTVYSTTTVTAVALFDEAGKIKNVQFDALEIVPEGEGAKAAIFLGWPDGKNITNDVDKNDVANWFTKRERTDANYGMPWSKEVNAYQEFFKGKTVAEIEAWYAKSASDLNNKVLNAKMTDPADIAKYAKLTDAEKKVNEDLVGGVNPAKSDTISGATISLKDGHGDFLTPLKEAFANKVEVK